MNNKSILDFKLSAEDMLIEAINRCKREMYFKAQPSVDYDKLIEQYKNGCKEKLYERYYLSKEEFDYIVNKYIEAYRLNDHFIEHCDLLIDNMTKGTITDKYIPEEIIDGVKHPGYRGYKDVPPLKDMIGESAANSVIDYINDRKDFYKTNHDLDKFRFNIYLSDTPTCDMVSVKKYWASKGIDLVIDPRKHSNDYFWSEENGYLEEEENE